nr:hypothetical protein [Alphaproteobacteria bacterium]
QNEPVLRNGEVVGYVTAGAYGYATGSAVGLCLVSLPEGETNVEAGEFTVMVEGVKFDANVSLTPFYDPKSKNMLD